MKKQATDAFAAAASLSDHDDLAARRGDACEGRNVRTVSHDKENSASGPLVDDGAGAGGKGLSLITQHDHIAKCRLGCDRSELQQRCRVHAAAPRRGDDSFDGNAFGFEPRADSCGVRAPRGAEIALSGAVVDPEARRIADAARGIGMAHQGDMTAGAQRRPDLSLAGAGAVRRGNDAEQDCEDGGPDAAHGGPRHKYAIRRPAQTALSHSKSDTSAVTLAPAGTSTPQRATRRHGPVCAITMLISAAAISSSLVWNAGLRTTCAASALNNRNPMLIASRKPKRDKGSSNCAIAWIGIARPNPSNLKSSATIDPTSTTKPRMCRISTAG